MPRLLCSSSTWDLEMDAEHCYVSYDGRLELRDQDAQAIAMGHGHRIQNPDTIEGSGSWDIGATIATVTASSRLRLSCGRCSCGAVHSPRRRFFGAGHSVLISQILSWCHRRLKPTRARATGRRMDIYILPKVTLSLWFAAHHTRGRTAERIRCQACQVRVHCPKLTRCSTLFARKQPRDGVRAQSRSGAPWDEARTPDAASGRFPRARLACVPGRVDMPVSSPEARPRRVRTQD
ncbi:hypothetical protein C2E23DRAFT_614645 [Lenzites betulinus]|nr:hypothetical protein C2E23DRAFT_614645 [Lenzites betulinus]